MRWSDQQQKVFDWFKIGSGNLVVRARAGSGKTSTILEAIKDAPESSILLAAFNKKISVELQKRVTKPGAEAKTLHGVGFEIVRRYWNGVRIDNDRGFRLAKAAAGQDAPDDVVGMIAKLASLAKGIAPFCDEALLSEIAVRFDKAPDAEWEDDGWSLERFVIATRHAMDLAMLTDDDGANIDFDDMIYVPVANRWVRPRYGLVVIDEAQDMNGSQLLLAQAVSDGRIAVVGDDRQAIYGFRGADSNAIDNLKSGLRATELGLTVTYRCAKTIVDYARTLVPDFVAHETNAVGEIVTVTVAGMLDGAREGDFVLSRKNAPLVGHCLAFLRAGRGARVEGRDIGAQLAAIVKARKAKGLPSLGEKMKKWQEIEIAKAKQKLTKKEAVEAKIQMITDQAETISALCDGVATVPELLARISRLFGDAKDDSSIAQIVLSSIHKSKGLEAERVYVLADTLYPGGDRSKIEEQNLEYVAVTRARRTLVWVKS